MPTQLHPWIRPQAGDHTYPLDLPSWCCRFSSFSCLLLRIPPSTVPVPHTRTGCARSPAPMLRLQLRKKAPASMPYIDPLLFISTLSPTLNDLTRNTQHERRRHPNRERHMTASGPLQDPSPHKRSYLHLMLAFSPLCSPAPSLHVAFPQQRLFREILLKSEIASEIASRAPEPAPFRYGEPPRRN